MDLTTDELDVDDAPSDAMELIAYMQPRIEKIDTTNDVSIRSPGRATPVSVGSYMQR